MSRYVTNLLAANLTTTHPLPSLVHFSKTSNVGAKIRLKSLKMITFTLVSPPLACILWHIAPREKIQTNRILPSEFPLPIYPAAASGSWFFPGTELKKKTKQMAVSSLEIVKLCGYSPVSSISRHKSTVKLESRKRVFRLADSRRLGRCVKVYSSSPRNGGDNQSKGQLFFSLLIIFRQGLFWFCNRCGVSRLWLAL